MSGNDYSDISLALSSSDLSYHMVYPFIGIGMGKDYYSEEYDK